MVPLGFGLIMLGAVGYVVRTVEFVRVTIPENYGSNPGFGAYESMVLPWFAVGFLGVGLLLGSWLWAVVPIIIAPFALGIIALLLGRLF